MNIGRTLALSLVGAVAMTGCVSIETLDQDLKSNDVKKQSAAVQKMSYIVTKGKVSPFTTFNSSDRLWCAKHITDTDEIVKIVETMSQNRWDPQAPQEVNDALMGMYSDVNAPILEVLLGTLGANEKVFSILTSGNITFGGQHPDIGLITEDIGLITERGRMSASKIHDVVLKYVESYVGEIKDKDTLNAMKKKYWNWRNMGHKNNIPQVLSERIVPSRFLALISSARDVKEFLDDNMLCNWTDNKFGKLAIAKISSQKDLSVLVAECPEWSGEIIKRITDADILAGIALSEKDATWQHRGSSAGEIALEKISDRATLVRIALLAKNEVVSRQAKKKVGDEKAIVDGLANLLNSKKISEKVAEIHVKALGDEGATIALYNAAHGRLFKQIVFSKLSEVDRKSVRESNVAKCEQMITAAKSKANETFEMGGFYLGMDIADVDMLVGYYFPEWSIKESVDGDEKDIRVIYVPQQSRPLCRADKSGKVWQFNFGKNFLKKFFKYDVQDEREWARAYSKEHGIDMKHVFLNKETTVADMSGSFNVSTYKAWLNQDTWQWKNNAKGYRLVYFAEPHIETIHGNIVRQQALYQFRFVSAEAGTLRVTIEND